MFLETLQQVWALSDFSTENVDNVYTLCTIFQSCSVFLQTRYWRSASLGFVWRPLASFGSGNSPTYRA